MLHMTYCCEEAGMPFKLPFVLNAVANTAAISLMTLREFAGKTKLKLQLSTLMQGVAGCTSSAQCEHSSPGVLSY